MAHFIWQELITPDPDAAAAFYGSVVGWTTQRYEGGGDYRQFLAGGRGVGGLVKSPGSAAPGSASWMGYLGVSHVDEEVRALQAAGGSVLRAPGDIPTVGRFAVVADPQGAVFTLLAPLPREVPPPVAPFTPGHVGWHELYTTEVQAAFAFYAERYGWKRDQALDMGQMGTYQLFTLEGGPGGGMMKSPFGRSLWLHYFIVTDIDAAKAAVDAGGGRILHGPSEVPGGGWILQALDPQGAMFAVTGPRQT